MNVFYILSFFIILIISKIQKINSIESFNDLFKNQKEINKLVKDINKFKKFFNISENYLDDQLFEEEKLNPKLIDSEKQNKESDNNIMEVKILELGKFIQTNYHLIIFNALVKFIGINPSEKISFTLQCFTKNNEKSDSNANCIFLEFGKNPQIGVYKCRCEVNGKISSILPYDDILFDKNKIKAPNENFVFEGEMGISGKDKNNLDSEERDKAYCSEK